MKVKAKTRLSGFLASTLLMACSLAASIALAEVVVRHFYPQKLSLNVSQWDPYVGFANIPGLQGYSETSDYVMHVSINSHGLRDREIDYVKPRNVFRIGLFGDSFTFGEGVQNSEAYPKVLEGFLNRERHSPIGQVRAIEVINFGIGKTGTSHQYALFQKQGVKYQLDLVVVGFFARNDFDDNWGGVFYLAGDTLVHNPTAYSTIRRTQRLLFALPFYKWAATHSHLMNLFRRAATIIDDRARVRATARLNGLPEEGRATADSLKYRVTVKLLEEFSRQARLHGGEFMLLNLPSKEQAAGSHDASNDVTPGYVLNGELLLRNLHGKQIRILDLLPLFAALPVSTHYFVRDGHMTTLGHQAIARSLQQYLVENRLVPLH